jgi:hypothetical protein
MARARERWAPIVRIVLAAPLAFIVPPATVATFPGCSPCAFGGSDIGLPGLEVTVLDSPGGPTACLNTVVWVREGSYSETLDMITAGDGSCTYQGVSRPGTYTIEVNQSGRIVTIENVRVVDGECHIEKTKVTATLPPPNP